MTILTSYLCAISGSSDFGAKKAAISGRPLSGLFSEVVYAPFTFSACQPLGPLTTSNCTC